jgi:4-aminobutyrate--pyruvate transaminase
MWASEALGLEPDAVTSAKGLTSAYMPLAAILLGEDLAERIERGSREKGWLAHGGTHHGHAVSAAVALEVLAIFEERDVLGHVRRTIPVWNRMLDRLQDHPLVVGTRRFGLMGAVEVAPPGAGRSGPAATLEVGGIAKAIYEAGLEQGIITRPLAGCLCLAPPLITTEAEIDEIGRRLGAALDQVLATLPRARAAE